MERFNRLSGGGGGDDSMSLSWSTMAANDGVIQMQRLDGGSVTIVMGGLVVLVLQKGSSEEKMATSCEKEFEQKMKSER
jgi:hypothetical protein